MILPIIFPSAVYFWSNHDFIGAYTKLIPENRRLVTLPENYKLCTDKDAIQQILMKYKIPGSLSVLAPNPAERRKGNWINSFIRPVKFPEASFVELETIQVQDGRNGICECRVLIAVPELCFLQASVKRPFLEVVRLGYDLCRIYQPDDANPVGQRHRNPPVTTDLLQSFLDGCTGMNGCQSARKALQYVRDHSNSPMETRLAMLQTLPFGDGGFHISGQTLNENIILSEQAAGIFTRPFCNCDAVWRDAKVVMEYDSNKTHLSVDQHDWDKRKTSALMTDGFKVFSVTNNMTATIGELEKTFVALRSLLGKRTDLERIAATRDKRRELIQFLKKSCWWESKIDTGSYKRS